MKLHLVVSKRQSKKGTSYLTCAFRVGDIGKNDYFFISLLNAMALTGMSIEDIQKADFGVLCDKDLEV